MAAKYDFLRKSYISLAAILEIAPEIAPEYGRLFRFGLINYVYYVCKLRGLSALSGERDSLLRCVGGAGEAGASYVNKWFNCNQELFLLFPFPLSPLHIYWVLSQNFCIESKHNIYEHILGY